MAKQALLCTRCLTVAVPTKVNRGSFAIELMLWLCFCVPGLLYTLWRVTSGVAYVCPSCGGNALIPPDSPAARHLLGRA